MRRPAAPRLVWRRLYPTTGVGGLLVLFALPLVVALGALRHPRYYPVGDLAEIEIRVRDVATAHPPLVGLIGRLGPIGGVASHPGPLVFWLMWPFYRAFGSSSWALDVASVALHMSAIGVVLWIAYRRGGTGLLIGVGAMLAVLLRAYGPSTLTQAWTPYVPLLWWLSFLLAVWSVLCDDLVVLPVAVFAGSLCAQAHVAYVGLVGGLGVVVLGTLAARARRSDGPARRELVHRLWIPAVLGIVLWLPPLVDQVVNSPGNLHLLFDYFLHSPGSSSGPRQGLHILFVHLNPWRLVSKQLVLSISAPGDAARGVATGSVVPGVLLLASWMGATFVAWRLRHRTLLRLDAVLGATLVLAALSMSRIVGTLWYWLVIWAWTVTALMVLSIVWSIGLLADRVARAPARPRIVRAIGAAGIAVAIVATAGEIYDAPDVEVQGPGLSQMLAGVVPSTVAALRHSSAPGTGRHARYLVTFTNPLTFDIPALGLLDELDRAGFDAGLLPAYRGAASRAHVFDPNTATAVIHLSVGADVDVWNAKRDAARIAYVDPRGQGGRAEYERLRSEVVEELQQAGLSDLAPNVDQSPMITSFDPRVPRAIRDRLSRMTDLGLPVAVFLAPISEAGAQ